MTIQSVAPASESRTPLRPKLSLDGAWDFRHESQSEWHQARVPGYWQAQFPDLCVSFGRATYARDISIPGNWTGHVVALCFGAVSDTAIIRLDGIEIGRHEGGYLPFDVTLPSGLTGLHRLEVETLLPDAHPNDGSGFAEIPHGKQSWYGPQAGIWQSVSLEARDIERVLSKLKRASDLAKERITERLKPFLPGVKLDGVTVHDLHPPAEVVNAYHAVAEAIQNRDRAVNEATADATRAKRRAEEDAFKLVHQAEADASRKLFEATANRDAFLAWLRERNALSDAEENQLKADRETRLRAGVDAATVEKEIAAARERMRANRKWLTEFRLALAATAAVLAGRDKIILDADLVPGRRTIYLFDPELFRVPVPKMPES